ncbi:Glycosyl transferase family 2 [Rhodococcus sp. RD6.2]|uniref:glycosyltransferase n=1 Tax=Rhodococcus sp. RD6.2 TaxID=260936 RepID=UPI00063B8A5C|nr:glycosyltransferase [Rhodococcus sp. RD6.2]CRK52201.1 Glycosyl transferase family 2 [Rhodococcus sp. RD6.2]
MTLAAPPPHPDSASAEFREQALHDAVHGLRERDPDASASVAFVPWQRALLIAQAAVFLVCLFLWPQVTLTVVTGVCTVAYVLTLGDRLAVFRTGLAANAIIRVSDEQARAIPDADLPPYTVLVPAYHEPEVIGQLLRSLSGLDYPRDKLQILLLLEEDDDITITAANEAGVGVGELVTVLLVPAADPRTKPKACNYGLHFATGDIITIYDAEDLPEPLQLRRVAATFAMRDDRVACVQAKLAYLNGGQNLLTGWFTVEYGVWFSYLLPGLMRLKAPIPLGGTSNHLRRSVLDDIGAWDPFNVTEDSDLGVRIAARGYTTAVLESTTLEEANSDPINWMRQRSRWYKGYLQTWLVHTRHPVRLWKQIGPWAFVRFTLLLAGTPLIACLNMVFWFITIAWVLGQPVLIGDIFPPWVYFPALVCLLFGNAATIYMNLIGARETGNPRLLWSCLLVPLYWLLMSIAAIKGVWQLLFRPSYWEKTFHGLASESDTDVDAAAAVQAESTQR